MRIAIISDIHEDVESLKKALHLIYDSSVDLIVCLGDIVGYEKESYFFENSRDASACIKLVSEHCNHVVIGNHDLYALKKLPSYYVSLNLPANWYTYSMEERVKKSSGRVWTYKTEEPVNLRLQEKKFIDNMPETQTLKAGAYQILFSHFLYPDATGCAAGLSVSLKQAQQYLKWMSKQGLNISFIGHTHADGLETIYKRKHLASKFGYYKLKYVPQIICCPAIARGNGSNGFVIFDTGERELEVISLV